MNIEAKKIELVKLILETDSEQILTSVRNILKSSQKMDETDRILANPGMEEKLNKSIQQAKDGRLRTVKLDEIASPQGFDARGWK